MNGKSISGRAWRLALLAATSLALAGCQKEPASSPDPLQQGAAAFKQGSYDQAITAYLQAIDKNPQDHIAYNLLGMAYRFKYNQAPGPALKEKEIAAFTKSVELKPDYVVALVNLGTSYYYSGRRQKAAPIFAKVLELMPNHPDAASLKKMIAEAGTASGNQAQPAAASGSQPAARQEPPAR